MKAIKAVAIILATIASAQAATVTLSAGFGTSGILVTTSGANTAYSAAVGGFVGGIFTPMPINVVATSPNISIASGAKIAGSFITPDNLDSASLSGDAIFVRISAGAFTAILSTPAGELFPDLTSGIASNSVTMGSSATVSVVQFSGEGLQSASFSNPTTLNFVPSLLGQSVEDRPSLVG